MKKSDHFYKKFIQTQINSFYLFAYFPIINSKINTEINHLINKNGLKKLILPSSFKVVKDQTVQGPCVGIVYSSSLNFKKLPHLYNLKAISFKLKDKWYAYDLLLDLKPYNTSFSLCLTNNKAIFNKIGTFFQYIKHIV